MMGVRHGIIAVANAAAMVAFACTNDYGKLDFSGGLDGSAGTADAGGDASASGGTGGNPNTGGSSGSSGTGGGGAGGTVDSGMDSSAGGAGGTGGTSGSGGSAGAGGGGSGGTPPDTGGTGGTAPEAGVPDAGTPSCDQLYGSATGYIFCSEDATSCTFYATTSSTCDALCTGLGGTCIAASDNSIPPGQECNASNTLTCATSRPDAICTCSRP